MRELATRLTACLAVFLAAPALPAEDSGGYRGPQNNGIYPSSGLIKTWPEEGPPLLWKCWIDQAYANGMVRDDTVYIAAQILGGGSKNYVHVISSDGKVRKHIQAGDARWKRYGGTRSSGAVSGNLFVTTTPNADIYAVDLETQETRWNLNAWKSFGAGKGEMGWGYPESPALHDDTIIFNTCSRFDETPPLVAVDIPTGRTVWSADAGHDRKYSAADASGAVFRHGGRDLLVHPTYRYLVCLEAETGKPVWEIPSAGPKNVTPIYNDGLLFWDGGMLKLSADGNSYDVLWRRPALGGMAHGVILNGRLYIFGNPNYEPRPEQAWTTWEDGIPFALRQATRVPTPGDAATHRPLTDLECQQQVEQFRREQLFLCLDARTGVLLHSIPSADPGHIVAADGMVYVQELIRPPDGRRKLPAQLRLTLIQPTADGFEIAGRFIPTLTWEESHWEFYHYAEKSTSSGKLIGFTDEDFSFQKHVNPVIAGGRLYVRFGPLMCFDLRAPAVPAISTPVADAPQAAPVPGAAEARLWKAEDAPPQAAAGLLKRFDSRFEDDRHKAVESWRDLDTATQKQAIPALLSLLDSPEKRAWFRQKCAAHVLTSMGPQAQPAVQGLQDRLIGALRCGDAALTELLSATLAAIDPGSLTPVADKAVDMLRRGDEPTRILCIRLLDGKGPMTPALPAALAEAINAPGKRLPHAAGCALAKMGPRAADAVPALRQTLLSRLKQKQEVLALFTLDTIREVGGPEALTGVAVQAATFLTHDSVGVQRLTLDVLARCGNLPAQSLTMLRKALASPDQSVREKAEALLGHAGDGGVPPTGPRR